MEMPPIVGILLRCLLRSSVCSYKFHLAQTFIQQGIKIAVVHMATPMQNKIIKDSNAYNFNILYVAMFLMFLTGFLDDLIALSPLKKVVFQFIISILVIAAGFRIESAFGLCSVG